MRLVQITDLHIDTRDPAYGQPALKKFRRTISRINEVVADALIMTGDFCLNEPRIDIYESIASELAHTTLPTYFIGGNHDSIEQMTAIFDLGDCLTNGELYYSVPFGDHEVIFLDTHGGMVSERQLDWLRVKLSEREGPAILFSHHPPMLAGVPFMDRNYPLKNHAEVLAILQNHPFCVDVFCGHYHVERSVAYQNVRIHITPSASYQIDPMVKDFARDHDNPGYRIIDLQPDRMETAVRYLWE